MLLDDLLTRQKGNPKIALKEVDREISYNSWFIESLKLSTIIRSVLSAESANVAILLPNSIEYGLAYFAILFSKRVIVPIWPKSKPMEILNCIKYCEIDLLITSFSYKEFLRECFENYEHKIYMMFIEAYQLNVLNCSSPCIEKTKIKKNNKKEDDVALMLHTSGTTNDPKRVMLSHNNLIQNIKSNIESLKLTEEDISLIALPMCFGYCNTSQFLTHVYLGATNVILNKIFWPNSFFNTVEKEKITNFFAVPSMLIMLLRYRYSSRYNISSLKYICFGGGKISKKQINELTLKFNTINFIQTYGLTEASPRVTALVQNDTIKKMGSVGKAIPGVEIKVVDEEGRSMSNYCIGEIIIFGKNIMKGYYKNEVATAKVLNNGWLHSGDLGYIDEDGFLFLTGRKKNVIISGGINIYPEEIEEVILQHPNVKEAYVFSDEDEILGEIPVAKVILVNKENKIDLKEFCKLHISDYKIPRRFEIVNSLPKTYNGKVKRYDL